jgi:hypothetical protein
VQEVLRDQRADRTDVDHVVRPHVALEPVLVEGVDHRAVAALHDRQALVLGDLAHEADAAGTHDAAVALVEDVPPEVVPAEDALRLVEPAHRAALLGDVVLQAALAGLVADRAVERVVDEEELQHALAGLHGLLALRVDDVPVGHLGGAGRHELGGSLQLHQAHPTLRRSAETGMVAVVEDVEPHLRGCVDHPGALGDLDGDAVDGDGDEILRLLLGHACLLGLHADRAAARFSPRRMSAR